MSLHLRRHHNLHSKIKNQNPHHHQVQFKNLDPLITTIIDPDIITPNTITTTTNTTTNISTTNTTITSTTNIIPINNHSNQNTIKIKKKKTFCFVISKTFKCLKWLNMTYLTRYITSSKYISGISIDLSQSKFNSPQITPLFKALRTQYNSLKSFSIRVCLIKAKAQIDDHALKNLSLAIKSLKKLQNIDLCFEGLHHEITNEGLNFLSSTISLMPYLNCIKFSLSGKNLLINEYGLQNMCKDFQIHKNIRRIYLDIGKLKQALSSAIYDSLIQLIKDNQNLTEISLCISESHKMITDEQIKIMIDEIIKLKSLKILNISFWKCSVGLTDNGLIYFSSKLKHIQSTLRNITLNFSSFSKKYITNTAWLELSKTISDFINIHTLDLVIKTPAFNDDSLWELTKSILSLNQLENITIAFVNNHLKEDNFVEFFKGLSIVSNNYKKISFDLSSLALDKFSDKSLIAYSQCISKASRIKLKEIDLTTPQKPICKITDEGLKKLGNALGDKEYLQKFILSIGDGENIITDKGLISLCRGMKAFTNLEIMSLGIFSGNNRISDKGMIVLSDALSKMKHLEDLSLYFEGDRNHITDYSLKELGKNLSRVYSLLGVVLYLSNNSNGITYLGLYELIEKVAGNTWTESLKLHISGDEIDNESYREKIKILERKCLGVKFMITTQHT